MTLPGACTAPSRCGLLLVAGALVGGIPLAALAGWPGGERSLADKLRYGPGQTNHPVQVRPSANVQVPAGWPLDADGSLTCITCHETLPDLRGGTDPYLRDFDAEAASALDFCAKCHTEGGQAGRSMHWMAVGRAHLGPEGDQRRRSAGQLDAESRTCLSCHDGVNAAESVNPAGGGHEMNSYGDRGRNHPIGVMYPSPSARRAGSPLRVKASLPPEIRLPDGRVSCVSCHNLYAGRPGLLTVPIEGSQLCFGCHDLDR